MAKKLLKKSPTTSAPSKLTPVAPGVRSILDEIKPVSELDLVLSALFYGRAGTGKTALSASFPKPMLILDIGEKGTDTVSDVPGVDVAKIKEWDDIEDIYYALKNGDIEYKSVSIDAMHTMQDLALTECKKREGKDEGEQTSQRIFGQASGLMKQWVYAYRDLNDIGIHVAFIAHDRVRENEQNDDEMLAPEVGPRLMPSVASMVTGAVKVVGHTFVREDVTKAKIAGGKPTRKIEYCLRIGPHGIYTTKMRNPKKFIVPPFLVDPTFDKIISAMKGKSQVSNEETSAPPIKRRLLSKE